MFTVTLPDGNTLQFENPATVYEIAACIGAGLAKAALAGQVGDQLVDTHHTIESDANLRIITSKDPEGIDIIRHSTAHLMAHAVKLLFPKVLVAIGPTIENGFYYDFDFEERSFTIDDLTTIEKKMQALVKQAIPFKRKIISKKEALKLFKKEKYKTELIEELPETETISIYEQDDFMDLCRGPHVPHTGHLGAFKLNKLAGAYWRGNPKNEMLQRIYGTAWANKKDLENYLHKLEEAEKRDHRKLGKHLDLFHTQEEAPGMIFWHSKGWTIYQTAIQHMRHILCEYDYQEIAAPLILDRSLWEKSGHWDKFSDSMFTTASENRDYAIKPMNCPGHIQIFNQGIKSYRDLPLYMAEFGMCHRNEASGTLHGLMRTRQFTQDDAHVFCTEDQIQPEVIKLIQMVYRTYSDFGFHDVLVRLATRPDKRIGEDAIWDKAEHALEIALNKQEISWESAPGEGAFYGPKIEFHLKDCLDRVWQCGTIQVDCSMPARLGAQYVDEEGVRKSPIMIHRAVLGSVERFIGMLLEHYAGLLPVWLSPIQVVAMNITDRQAQYTQEIVKKLKNFGIRATSDLRNEKIGFKIREQTLQKIPYQLIIGDHELEQNTVSIRTQQGKDLGSMSLDDFINHINADILERN